MYNTGSHPLFLGISQSWEEQSPQDQGPNYLLQHHEYRKQENTVHTVLFI